MVHPCERRYPAPGASPNYDGWQTAVSRCTRKVLRRLERHPHPRRPVPIDLLGKCFNCFSPQHRAATCSLVTWCFHCRELGHRAHGCSARRVAPSSSCVPQLVWRSTSMTAVPPCPRQLVWRPVSSAAPATDAPAATTASSGGSREGRGREEAAPHAPWTWWCCARFGRWPGAAEPRRRGCQR